MSFDSLNGAYMEKKLIIVMIEVHPVQFNQYYSCFCVPQLIEIIWFKKNQTILR